MCDISRAADSICFACLATDVCAHYLGLFTCLHCVLQVEQAKRTVIALYMIVHFSSYVHDNIVEHSSCKQSQFAMPMFTVC